MSNIPADRQSDSEPRSLVRPIDSPCGLVVGVIGGIASGKSEVSKLLEAKGASVFNADAAGHRLLTRPDIRQKIIDIFGVGCLDENGVIDRKHLAKSFFSGPSDQLSQLESILHPVIRQQAVEAIEAFRKDRSMPMLILDVPLLIEAGWQSLCNKIIFVDTPLEVRLANAKRRGWSHQELLMRESTQLPLDKKKGYATDIVQNIGSIQDLRNNLLELPWLARLPSSDI